MVIYQKKNAAERLERDKQKRRFQEIFTRHQGGYQK